MKSVEIHNIQFIPVLCVCVYDSYKIEFSIILQLSFLFSFKTIDLSKNNITTLSDTNFRGQDNLHELDLSHNRIQGMTSWVFHHLKVSLFSSI